MYNIENPRYNKIGWIVYVQEQYKKSLEGNKIIFYAKHAIVLVLEYHHCCETTALQTGLNILYSWYLGPFNPFTPGFIM